MQRFSYNVILPVVEKKTHNDEYSYYYNFSCSMREKGAGCDSKRVKYTEIECVIGTGKKPQ